MNQAAVLFDVKQLAKAVKLSCQKREESWDEEERKYKLQDEEACILAVNELHLPKELWRMVHLSLHWWNDINDWADSVLNDTFDKDYEVVGEKESSKCDNAVESEEDDIVRQEEESVCPHCNGSGSDPSSSRPGDFGMQITCRPCKGSGKLLTN